MPWTRAKRTSRLRKGGCPVKGQASAQHCSAGGMPGRAHSTVAFFWAGRELKLTEISSSRRLFRKGFAFCSTASWFKQGSSRLQWDVYVDILSCLREAYAVRRVLSNSPLGVWGLRELKALKGPGRIFNIFKYLHESKNMTFCYWNCKTRRLFFYFFFFGCNLNVKEISCELILTNALRYLSDQSTLKVALF